MTSDAHFAEPLAPEQRDGTRPLAGSPLLALLQGERTTPDPDSVPWLTTDRHGQVRSLTTAARALLGPAAAVDAKLQDAMIPADSHLITEVLHATDLPAVTVPRLRTGAHRVVSAGVVWDHGTDLAHWTLHGIRSGDRVSLDRLPAVGYACEPTSTWNCVSITRALEPLLGFSPSRWTADPHRWLKQVHPDDRERLVLARLGLLEGGDDLSIDYRMRTANGGELVVHDRARLGDDGLVHGLLTDVTRQHERRRVLDDVQEASIRETDRLSSLLEARDVYFRTIVHDVRSLLTAAQPPNDGDPVRDAPSPTFELIAQAHRLLDDALAIERQLSDYGEFSVQPVRVRSLVADAIDGVHLEGRELTIEASDGEAHVHEPLVRRVLHNLVRNAVQHTPVGTTIRVTARVAPIAATFVVEDDGPGIADEDKEQAWQAGVHATTSSGRGMGLALVRQLIDLHGGQVWVEDSPLGGAAFVVRLPGREPSSGRR